MHFSRAALLASLAVSATAQTVEARFEDARNWATYDGDNTGRRYRELDQITPANVKRLTVQWAFQYQPAISRSLATPLAQDGIVYISGGGSTAYAIDGRTGRTVWRYDYPFAGSDEDRKRDWNRGVALSGNRLFLATIDCHVVALDRRNGALLWRSKINIEQPCLGSTAAPFVVKNLVLIGNSGGDTGLVRGFVDAFDTETGERSWRLYTVPKPGEKGSETWGDNDAWKGGGAATWTTGSYDPDLDLLYWPTGNPGPKDFDGRDRPGDNLYTASVLAIRPDTGELVWHFQFTPHDEHDWDANETPVLVDADWQGKPRKLLLHADRNGFFYVLDRATGKFLQGTPFAKQTWAKGLTAEGRPVLIPEAAPAREGPIVCPDIHGGTNWQSPAFNPATRLFYLIARDGCGRYYQTGYSIDYELGEAQQYLRALDIQTGKLRWEIPFLGDESQEINHAGAMTTSGGLVFFSSREGNFMAADAKTGELLWGFNTGGNIRASPMTYEAGGKQYVAVATKAGIFAFGLFD
ncbi:MAG: PQQ-binding-like beta-propeller repeat protein [Acidobacteria bacterium]|nr:PQQ-binding-like beta-propeller repeat protein [Acidobacteriota bacterium]